jgi:hypothetical protein
MEKGIIYGEWGMGNNLLRLIGSNKKRLWERFIK